jgi:hypothetical protein
MYQQTFDPNVLHPNPRSRQNNPNGNFTQITYQMDKNSQFHNFDKAFQSNEPLIERQNFRNQNNMLHNNVHENIQSEYITNYTIDIDSNDRNTTSYPNPFKYTVFFAPVTKGIENREEWIDPMDHSKGRKNVKIVYNGPPAPYIKTAFKNLKYIRVDNVILPKYHEITEVSGEWILDTTKDLSQDRYVVMKFTNIESRYNLSTNPIVESSGIKLIPNTIPTFGNFYYAIPANSNNIVKTFPMSSLGNLDRLYVEFYDSAGNLLKYNNLDSEQPIDDVRNPGNVNLQNNITLIYGVVENELATEIKFSE